MPNNGLRRLYFEWMCKIVHDDDSNRRPSYKTLLYYIFTVDFQWVLDFDENRAKDGTDLRYRFGHEVGYDRSAISAFLDDRPCSVFELMLALSIRCEEQFMGDPYFGDRTGQWFWNMIINLGLGQMDDSRFDPAYTYEVISAFMERRYEKNGRGGLFAVQHRHADLRTVQIWDQMCWYLDEIV